MRRMTESIEPHYRTPRTQYEAGIDHLEWDHAPALRPLYWDVLAALGLVVFIATVYWLAVVM